MTSRFQDSKGNDLTHAGHTVKVGEKVKLVATYWDDDEWDDVELSSSSSEYAQLSYQWYVGTKQSSAPTASGYEPISGATSRELTLTSDLAGKYVACKVTYGSSSWQYKFTGEPEGCRPVRRGPVAQRGWPDPCCRQAEALHLEAQPQVRN